MVKTVIVSHPRLFVALWYISQLHLSLTLHVHGGRQATSRRRSRRPAGVFRFSTSDREVAKASARQSSARTAARASLKVGVRFGYQRAASSGRARRAWSSLAQIATSENKPNRAG